VAGHSQAFLAALTDFPSVHFVQEILSAFKNPSEQTHWFPKTVVLAPQV